MTRSSRAVFLSYASQDAEAVQHLCAALHAAGIEVWFDRSELRGGVDWDQMIQRQIRECMLFIAVISARTEARPEGYFRREWRLPGERARDIADDEPFLIPVVIDATSEATARVPERFRTVQWTRMPGGGSPGAFVERMRRLLSADPSNSEEISVQASPLPASSSGTTSVRSTRPSSRSFAPWIVSGLLILLLCFFIVDKFLLRNGTVPVAEVPDKVASTAFNPPSRSIAVLPLTNLSGDAQQEYFSDGMTEEIINALAQISALSVIARTSSFSFKGKNTDIGTIARVLNVGAILEGSVRRSGTTVRVTVQLINALNGYHIWSHDYDRDLKNVLAMQSEIATVVAQQFEAKLLTTESARIEADGTQNPQAFDAFLAGKHFRYMDPLQAIANLQKAVRLDPSFARAWAFLANMYGDQGETAKAAQAPMWFMREREAAERALGLDPQLVAAHAAMAWVYRSSLNWAAVAREVEAAEAIDATSPLTLNTRSNLEFELGHWEQAIRVIRRALELDPLNVANLNTLAGALSASGFHTEAAQTLRRVLEIEPHIDSGHSQVAQQILFAGHPREAIAEANLDPNEQSRDFLLVMAYYFLGQRVESDRLMASFDAKYASDAGHEGDMAYLLAFRGEMGPAYQRLDRAFMQHDPGLYVIKGNFGVLPNIKGDPRYIALLQKLGLPQ